MWGGTLQFEYRDNDELFATNATHSMRIEEAFDFQDYVDATNTPSFPPLFQTLVNNAIEFHLAKQTRSMFRSTIHNQMAHSFNRFPIEINRLIFQYLDEYSIPGFATWLMPHQIDALEFISTRPASLLAAATGLGKTAVSLAFAVHNQAKRILIVCPPTLQSNWEHEIVKFVVGSQNATLFFNFDDTKQGKKKLTNDPPTLPLNNPIFVCVNHSKEASFIFHKLGSLSKDRTCLVLVRYNLLQAISSILPATDIRWDAMIFDEAHYLKCKDSQRSKAVMNILQNSKPKFRILLSATPSPSTKDWWNLLRIMDPILFAKFFHYKTPGPNYLPSKIHFFFAERYIQPRSMRTGGGILRWNFDHSARMKELHALTRPYVLCQTKDMLNLPPFIREYVIIGQATQQQQKQYSARIQSIISKNGSSVEIQSSFQQIIQQASVDKMPFIKEYISSMLESSHERFIVWVHFKLTMQDLAQYMNDKQVKYITINGDTPQAHRDELLDMFESNVSIRVALLSIDTCGTGLNLTFIHTSIYAELTYNHVAQIQSEGRCHRIGQTAKCVTALYLIFKHSPDEMIWNSMLRKANIESLVLTNKKADFNFDMRDLKNDLVQFLKDMQEHQPNIWQNTPKRTLDDTVFVFSSAKRKKQLE